jgi:hypothetical protein
MLALTLGKFPSSVWCLRVLAGFLFIVKTAETIGTIGGLWLTFSPEGEDYLCSDPIWTSVTVWERQDSLVFSLWSHLGFLQFTGILLPTSPLLSSVFP